MNRADRKATVTRNGAVVESWTFRLVLLDTAMCDLIRRYDPFQLTRTF